MVTSADTQYRGANHTHLTELLREREDIDIGRATLRRIAAYLGQRRAEQSAAKASVKAPCPPPAYAARGNDDTDGPQFTLLIAVDDATGTVVYALFCEKEDARSYFLLIQGIVQRCGVLVALYTDRHGVFWHIAGSGWPVRRPSSAGPWRNWGFK